MQLYLTHPPKAGAQTPLFALKNFRRVMLQPGGSTQVNFTLTPAQLALIDKNGTAYAPSGPVTVYVGGSLPSARSLALGAAKPASAVITVK
ncbi:MAG: fibronectin type III-like domain-contianing protein [Hymenobacter sp.]